MDQTGGLPADAVLGWIVIFEIRKHTYDRSVMEATFDELDMNPSMLPAPNNPLHAFQKATSSVDDTDYDLPNGNQAHILVREQKDTKEMLVRQLTREVRDKRRGALGYDKIGECVFYRPKSVNGTVQYGSERIRLTVDNSALGPQERPALQQVIDKITAEYERFVNFVDEMKMRQVVRNYLVFLNGLKIKDGFYFVHQNRHEDLVKLATLVERMGGGSTLFTMPLVDLGETRKMVIEAYQVEAEEALNDVVKKIAHVRETRKNITPDAYAKLKREYETAVQRSKEYGRTLKVRQTTTGAAQELAQQALTQLQMDMMNADASEAVPA
jgi:hypothetical protein